MFPVHPKIAIVGAGAVGAYYGSLLSQNGHEVHVLARSDYPVVKDKGYLIRQKDKGKEFVVKPAGVHQTPESIGPCDLVIIALKTTANDQLERLVKPLVKSQTLVLTLQNGLGNIEKLAEFIPAPQLLGGLCFVCINRIEPGVIENYIPGQLYIGEFMGSYRERTMQVVEMFENAGVQAFFSRSLEESIWRKLCWNIPFNGLAIAGGGITTDKILEIPELLRMVSLLMMEVQAAALAYSYKISDKFLESQIEVTRGMGPYRPSSLIDYLSGKEVEVESIWGEPLRRGQARLVPMPHLESLYLLLKALCRPGPRPVSS